MNKTIGVEISTNNPKLDGWAYAHLELPATDYEIRDAMQQARCVEGKAQDCNIINCDVFPALRETRLMPTTLSELNFLAKRLAGLNEDEGIVLRALTDKIVKRTPENKTISVKDIINHTYNLDKVSVISNVTTDEQLGQFVIENDAFEEIKQMPDSTIELLDKAAVGKKLRESEGGAFEGGMYVITSEYPYKEVYDGRTLPIEANENWFAFRLLVAKTPQDGLEEMEKVEENAEWLSLPVDKEEANHLAMKLGEAKIEDCVYLHFESSIPQITDCKFGDMQKFDMLNEVAEIMDGLEWEDEVKFKAILSAKNPRDTEGVLKIAREIDEYELDSNIINEGGYFREYLRQYLPQGFDKEWINALQPGTEGEWLIKRTGAEETDYGYISRKGEMLYPLVNRHSPEMYLNDNFDIVDVFGKTGIYTTGGVPDNAVPQGLYKYEFRGGGLGDLSTIEKRVGVNFTGTLLMKEPLDLGEEGYRNLGEDDIAFWEEGITLQEYLNSEHEIKMGGIE